MCRVKKKGTINFKRLWYLVYFIYLGVEFVRPQDVFSVIAAIRPGLVFTLLLALFVVLNFKHIRCTPKHIKYFIYFVLLLLVLVPFAHNWYAAYKAFWSVLLYLPFVFSTILLFNDAEKFRRLIFANIVFACYVSIYSLLNGGVGSGSFLADENDVSLYFVIWLPFAYYMLIGSSDIILKGLFLLACTVLVAGIVFTFSRGGFVGLLAVMAYVWFKSERKIIYLFGFSIAALAVFLFADPAYWADVQTITDTSENTANSRINSWMSSIDMFIDNPWGVGGGNFPVLFDQYQGDRFSRSMWGRAAHSFWFTLLPETGVLGVFLVIGMFFHSMKDVKWASGCLDEGALKEIKFSRAFIASLIGFGVSASFISVLYYPHFWYLAAYMGAYICIVRRMKNS